MHQVLWTGGWDSTFRVLDLIINKGEEVVPLYLEDKDRKSAEIELRTIEAVKQQIGKFYPEAVRRLHGLKVYRFHEIAPDSEITAASNAIRAKAYMGSQYDWMARFCKEQGLSSIELSIHKDDKARDVIANYVTFSNGRVVIDEKHRNTDEYTLFHWFEFPLFDMTKMQMKAAAESSGFLAILENSWFCHSPINEKACGRCPPCIYTIEEGMAYRLPWEARFVRYPVRKLEKLLLAILPSGSADWLRRWKQWAVAQIKS